MPNTTDSNEKAVTRPERKAARTILTYALVAAVIALIAAAILTRSWLLFFLALIVFIPYAFLLMMPVWLARSTEVAQQARKQEEEEEPQPSQDKTD